MVTAPDKFRTEVSESEVLVEEFRQKIIVSLNKERERIKDVAEREAKVILTKAYQDAAGLNEKAQEESRHIIDAAREQASKEADILLAQVQIKAEQILKNAEEMTRRDAKERTKKEIDSILNAAHEEADKITSQTLQQAKNQAKDLLEAARKEGILLAKQIRTDAEKESRELILAASDMKQKATLELTDSNKKAEETAQKIIEKALASAREKAEKEALEIVEQARARSQKEREFTIASAVAEAKRLSELETTQILIKARQEAENIFNNARERVRVQLDESSRLMLEVQQKMHQIIDTTGMDLKKPDKTAEDFRTSVSQPRQALDLPKEVVRPQYSEPSPVIDKANSVPENAQTKINSLFFDEDKKTYLGRLKIDIAPPVDNDQIQSLENALSQTPNLRVIEKGEAEDGSAWVEIDMNVPVPLLDILRKVPEIKDVVGCKSYIIIALKSKQMV